MDIEVINFTNTLTIHYDIEDQFSPSEIPAVHSFILGWIAARESIGIQLVLNETNYIFSADQSDSENADTCARIIYDPKFMTEINSLLISLKIYFDHYLPKSMTKIIWEENMQQLFSKDEK